MRPGHIVCERVGQRRVRIPHPHCDRPTPCMRARPRHIAFCATDTAAHAQRNPRAGTPCKQFSRVPDMVAKHLSVLGHSGKLVPGRLNLRREGASEGAERRAQVGAMASGTSGDHGRLGTSEASLITTGDNLFVRLPGRPLFDVSGALAPPSSPFAARAAACPSLAQWPPARRDARARAPRRSLPARP